jgi:5'-3' exonuclease
MKTNVIMDVSSLFYSTYHAMSKEQDDILYAMANKSFMDIINKHHRESACDEVILAFDGKKNWRKTYTTSGDALTYKKYKGHRREKMTDAERSKLERFDEHVIEFREMLKEYTGLLVLQHERLEADDLIAGYIKMHKGEKHLIISPDRDYLQLLRYPHVSILDPRTNKQLTLMEYDNDPDYFIFHKCIRGDTGDNVMSSYPRLHGTKIKSAWTDDFMLNNIMKHEFTVSYIDKHTNTAREVTYKTIDAYEENVMLMDLTRQPEVIQEMIEKSIKKSKRTRGSYNMVKFMRYCNRMDFQHLLHSISRYNKLLKGPRKSIMEADFQH